MDDKEVNACDIGLAMLRGDMVRRTWINFCISCIVCLTFITPKKNAILCRGITKNRDQRSLINAQRLSKTSPELCPKDYIVLQTLPLDTNLGLIGHCRDFPHARFRIYQMHFGP